MSNFQALLNFMGEHPILAFFLAWMFVWMSVVIFKTPFWLVNRYLRSRNIKNAGWPPPRLDADGDVIVKEDAA